MENVAHRLFLNGYSVTEISEMTHFPKNLINDFVTKKVEESFSKTKTDLYS